MEFQACSHSKYGILTQLTLLPFLEFVKQFFLYLEFLFNICVEKLLFLEFFSFIFYIKKLNKGVIYAKI